MAAKHLMFGTLKRFLLSTFIAALLFGLVITATVYSESEPNDAKLFYVFVSVTATFTLLFWSVRFAVSRVDANRELANLMHGRNDKADQSFGKLVEQQYGPALKDNICVFEDFWKSSFRNDLNRHSIATIIVMFFSVVTVLVVGGIVMFFDQTDTTAAVVTAVGGALPALITATSLKIWLETRRNLDRSSEQMSLLLKQRIRMLLFWSRELRFEDEAGFQDHIRSCNLFLAYLRTGGEEAPVDQDREPIVESLPRAGKSMRSFRKSASRNGKTSFSPLVPAAGS